jgi:hypothetical protein
MTSKIKYKPYKEGTMTEEMKVALQNILTYIKSNINKIDVEEIKTDEKWPIDRMTNEIGKIKRLFDILEGNSLEDVLNIIGAGNLCDFNDIEIILKGGKLNEIN